MFNLKQDGFHVVLKKPCRAFFGLFDSTSVDRIYHFSLVARGFFSLEEGSHEMLLALAQARRKRGAGKAIYPSGLLQAGVLVGLEPASFWQNS